MTHLKLFLRVGLPFFALSFLHADLGNNRLNELLKNGSFLEDVDPVRDAGNEVLFAAKTFGMGYPRQKLNQSEQEKLAQWAALVSVWRNMLAESVDHEALNSIVGRYFLDTKWPKKLVGFVSGAEALERVRYFTPDVNVYSDKYYQMVLNGLTSLREVVENNACPKVREELAANFDSGKLNPLLIAQAHTFDPLVFEGEKLRSLRLGHLDKLIAEFKKRKKGGNDDDGGAAPAALACAAKVDESKQNHDRNSQREILN